MSLCFLLNCIYLLPSRVLFGSRSDLLSSGRMICGAISACLSDRVLLAVGGEEPGAGRRSRIGDFQEWTQGRGSHCQEREG